MYMYVLHCDTTRHKLADYILMRRFEKDIEDMLGHRPNWYWKIMWIFVSPLLLISLFISYIINYIQGGAPTYQAWDKTTVRDTY